MLRILILEPDDGVREVFQHYFQRHSFGFCGCKVPKECTHAARRFHPDVLVFEPDSLSSSEHQAISELGIPTIVTTRIKNAAERAMISNAVATLLKPFSMRFLDSQIRSAASLVQERTSNIGTA